MLLKSLTLFILFQISGILWYPMPGSTTLIRTTTLRATTDGQPCTCPTYTVLFDPAKLGNNSPRSATNPPITIRSLQLNRATTRSKHDSPDRPFHHSQLAQSTIPPIDHSTFNTQRAPSQPPQLLIGFWIPFPPRCLFILFPPCGLFKL